MQRPQQRHHTGSRSPSRYKEQKIFVLASKKSIEPTPIQRCLQELKLWRCSVTSTATSYKCRRSGVCALELLCSAERLISKEYSSRIRALTRGSQRIWIWIAKNCFFLISLQIATVIFNLPHRDPAGSSREWDFSWHKSHGVQAECPWLTGDLCGKTLSGQAIVLPTPLNLHFQLLPGPPFPFTLPAGNLVTGASAEFISFALTAQALHSWAHNCHMTRQTVQTEF